MASVQRIPNEQHLAKVREERARLGMPNNYARHPFFKLKGFVRGVGL